MRRPDRRCLLLVSAAITLACADSAPAPTQLMVIVNSDFLPGSELAQVVARVRDSTVTYAVRGDAAAPHAEPDQRTIPFSFGVAPREHAGEKVVIEVAGYAPDGLEVGRLRARVGFVPGEVRGVFLDLMRACTGQLDRCGEHETCRDAACVPIDLDVAALPVVEIGRELEGVTSHATAAPEMLPIAPERPRCSEANPPGFTDVARPLTRSADGLACPVVTQGDEWGASSSAREVNATALARYLERTLAVRADVIGLKVAMRAGTLVTYGFSRKELASAEGLPTLASALAHPRLLEADAPLQLVIEEPVDDPGELARALIGALRQTGAVRRCRPMYLFASGPTSLTALKAVQRALRSDPRSGDLWPLLHFGKRTFNPMHDLLLAELRELKASGFDRAGFSLQDSDLVPALTAAMREGLLTHVYNPRGGAMVAALCGLASATESLVKIDRLAYLSILDEVRHQVEVSRTALGIDLRTASASDPAIPIASLSSVGLRSVPLGPSGPLLVPAPGLRADVGSALSFDPARRAHLTLFDVDDDARRPELAYFAEPNLGVLVAVRLGRERLTPGERQVILSKRGPESGYALEYEYEGPTMAFRFTTWGVGVDDGRVRSASARVTTSDLGIIAGVSYLLYAHQSGGYVYLVVQSYDGVETHFTEPVTRHLLVRNDVPLTLGADPGGETGHFTGELQLVRITTGYY